MTSASFQELANAVLDGTATPEQRAALEAELEADAGARDQFHTLEIAFGALAHTPPLAPPAELKSRIMMAIRAERDRPRAGTRLLSGLSQLFTLRLASAFATGCAAGILVWVLATENHGSTAGLPTSGAMMPPAQGERIGNGITLGAGMAHATIEARRGGSVIEAVISARANGPAELILQHDPALAPDGIDPLGSTPRQVSFAPGRVALQFSGELSCTLRFRGASTSPLRVAIQAGDKLAEGVLDLSSR